MNKKEILELEKMLPSTIKDRPKYYNGFLYGEFGVGKTIVAASCVQNKGLLVATDSGTNSLFNHPELLDKVDVVPYNSLSHLTAIGRAITEGIAPYDQYDTIIIDTISQVQEEYLDWVLENFQFSGNYREKATPRAGKIGLSAEEITGLPDYHLARNKMRLPIKTLIKAPVDVWFLAHVREPSFTDVAKGKLVRRPTLTETVFKLIAREASLLGLMEREGKKRTIQFMTDKKTVSKSQIKELDDKIINADDLSEILHKWKVK